ncbi:MAG: ribonuclease HII, partial [Promethearchaeota archaeon]
MIIAGLDEAGRGPVIGPLVIGCALIKEENLHLLDEIGVDDSKKLSPKKRSEMAGKIRGICDLAETLVITSQEINVLHDIQHLTLNKIEEIHFGKLLNSLSMKPDKIYLDACDTVEERFGISIGKLLKFKPKKIISKHRGDSIFTVVGASSILAKTVRDEIIEEYKLKYGNIGSGYPSDPSTKVYLDEYYSTHRKFPPIVRTWWKTAENIVKKYEEKKKQRKLT